MKLTVRCFSTIRQVKESLWDGLLPAPSIFQSHRFIRTVEESGVEGARLWYLVFYHEAAPVAAAVLSAFPVALDLLTSEELPWVHRLRRYFPHFLRPTILCCGLPISVGHHQLLISDPVYGPAVLRALAQEMERIGREKGIDLLVVKEFPEGESSVADGLMQHGYFQAPSIPTMQLPLAWSSFGDYLEALRHPYRRRALRILRSTGGRAPLIRRPGEEMEDDRPGLLLGSSDSCPPGLFYELYLSVMERAMVKMETLPALFFEKLFELMGQDLKILAVKEGKVWHAVALLLEEGDRLILFLVGMEDPRDHPIQPYFNLLYGLTAVAIEEGYGNLALGQTTYWAKQQLGAEAIPVYFFMRARHPLKHMLLRLGKQRLFPSLSLRRPRVFKNSPGAAPVSITATARST